MTFGIATGEPAPTVVLVLDLYHNPGTTRLGALIDGVGIRHDEVGTLRRAAQLRGRGLQLAEIVVARRAEHDHARAERQLGVRDAALTVGIHRLLRKAEDVAE